LNAAASAVACSQLFGSTHINLTIMRLDGAHELVHSVYDSCETALEELNKLQNDKLFVSMEFVFDSDRGKMDEWLFENDIVAKKEKSNFKIPHTDLQFTISGYKFRNMEHAMAFKLRWYKEK